MSPHDTPSEAFDLARTVRLVRRAGDTRSVLMRRRFATTADELWATCTQADRLARWIGELRGDPSSGHVELAMGGDGHVAGCEILRCEPPRRLELIWSEVGRDDSVLRATITEGDGGAELAIEHLALTSPERILIGAGWEEFMADLADVLEDRERSHDCDALEKQAQAIWKDAPVEPDDRWGVVGEEEYVLDRTFAASADEVWRAIATKDGLGTWFGATTGDLTDDGRWNVAFDDGSASGLIESCRPGHGFVTTFVQDATPTVVHRVEVAVESLGTATRVRLRHGYADGVSVGLRRGLAAGWAAHLSGLGDVLSKSGARADAWTVEFQIASLVLR